MVDAANTLGCILSIHPVVIGLTVLAIGTSFPDFMSSIYAARSGYGDMAIANTLGSNIFDILIGLGIPWMCSSIIKPIQLHETTIPTQLVTVCISWFAGIILCWKLELNKKMGISLVILYVLYLIYLILQSYEVITF